MTKPPSVNKPGTDKVDPGNPPKATRFKPGQSGNPASRPRKDRDLQKLIEAELDVEIQLRENGNAVRLSKREVLVKRLVNDAVGGDAKALATLLRLIGTSNERGEREAVVIDCDVISRFLDRLPAQEETGS